MAKHQTVKSRAKRTPAKPKTEKKQRMSDSPPAINPPSDREFAIKIVRIFLISLVVFAMFLFIPAGTLDYWPAWLYLAVVFIPFLFAIAYLWTFDRALVARRMQYHERRAQEKKIISGMTLIFIIAFLIPGLDHRFGWSSVPAPVVLLADALVFLGYFFTFLTLKENSYASRTIRVEKGQKVISTGPYSLVRHPMYLGMAVMMLATPLALGSYAALVPFAVILPGLVLRIQDEEKMLVQELPGYKEYRQKTRYRLIPFIW